MQNGTSGSSIVTWTLPIDLMGSLCKIISSADTEVKKRLTCDFFYYCSVVQTYSDIQQYMSSQPFGLSPRKAVAGD